MNLRKFYYYTYNGLLSVLPKWAVRYSSRKLLKSMGEYDQTELNRRVHYYNKNSLPFDKERCEFSVHSFKKTGGTTYYLDIAKVINGFPTSSRFNCVPGDVTTVPQIPSFVKSRPISGNNENSVLLKLNAVRHFNFIDDSLSFGDKQDKVVWRGLGKKPHRKIVLEKFYDHPMCDIGRTAPIEGMPYEKGFLSIEEQLKYKFILAIEGNDVATNLKWAMSSNSLVVMTKPKFETWFMEGKLVAGIHYVEVKDDYSDMVDKMNYYLSKPKEAQIIIDNAHQWIEQFTDPKKEKLLSLLVAQKYFQHSK
ncbi:glycosyl transferase family 90 [Vibrio astriarenae]